MNTAAINEAIIPAIRLLTSYITEAFLPLQQIWEQVRIKPVRWSSSCLSSLCWLSLTQVRSISQWFMSSISIKISKTHCCKFVRRTVIIKIVISIITSSNSIVTFLEVCPPLSRVQQWCEACLVHSRSIWSRPLASGFSRLTANGKPEDVTWPRSCGRVCSLQFTFRRQEGLPAVSDLRQGFLPLKIVQPHV